MSIVLRISELPLGVPLELKRLPSFPLTSLTCPNGHVHVPAQTSWRRNKTSNLRLNYIGEGSMTMQATMTRGGNTLVLALATLDHMTEIEMILSVSRSPRYPRQKQSRDCHMLLLPTVLLINITNVNNPLVLVCHHDIQHKRLICDTQHKLHSTWQYTIYSVIKISVGILNVVALLEHWY